MEILTSVNVTKKDIVKATVSTMTASESVDTTINMSKIVVYKTEDNDGNELIVTAIGNDTEFITTVSGTVKNSIDTILATFTEEEVANGIDVIFRTGKTKNNRDFIYLDII